MPAVAPVMTPSARWSFRTSSSALGQWFVIHHTDCGMMLFTDNDMHQLLASSLKTATLDQAGWHDSSDGFGSAEGTYVKWLTFSDNAEECGRRRHPYLQSSSGTERHSHIRVYLRR